MFTLHISKAFDDKGMYFSFLLYIPCIISVIFDQSRKIRVSPVVWLMSFIIQPETSKGLVNIYNKIKLNFVKYYTECCMALSNISKQKKNVSFYHESLTNL